MEEQSSLQKDDVTQKYKWAKLLSWILLGIVLTYIVCAVSITDDHTLLTPFYNSGSVGDINQNIFRREIQQDFGYQDESGAVVLEQGEFQYTISLTFYLNSWNYLCVNIEELSSDLFTWKISYDYVKDGEILESTEKTYLLTEGMNKLSVPKNQFNRLRITVQGENGTSFRVGSVQFRETLITASRMRVMLIAVLVAACYLVVSWFLWTLYKKRRKSEREQHIRLYGCIDMLQEGWLIVIRRLVALRGGWELRPEQRRILRVILFLGIFCCDMYKSVSGISYSIYYLLICIVILMVISGLSIEKNAKKKNWNNPLVWGWLFTGFFMCFSDFVVQKSSGNYRFFGYVLIFFIGFFIFVWNNMKNRGEIIEEFVRAVHLFFWITVIFCILFRPDDGLTRYAGFTTNPNMYSIYLSAFWAVVMGSLENEIRKHQKKSVLLIYVIEACVVLSLVWKAQSVTGMLAVGMVTFIWLARMLRYSFRHQMKKMLMETLICALVLFVPVHTTLSVGLVNVPELLGTAEIQETKEGIERMQMGVIANASDSVNVFTNNRIYQKLVTGNMAQILSGRNYIYKEYLRDMNLFGHEKRPYVLGFSSRQMPHNEVLGRAYSDGIFSIIPYVIMLAAALVQTWKFSRKKIRYSSVPLLCCVAFLIYSIADNVDLPFYLLSWSTMYLLMGCAFCDEDTEVREALKTEDMEDREILETAETESQFPQSKDDEQGRETFEIEGAKALKKEEAE